jgi:hypothetical protein
MAPRAMKTKTSAPSCEAAGIRRAPKGKGEGKDKGKGKDKGEGKGMSFVEGVEMSLAEFRARFEALQKPEADEAEEEVGDEIRDAMGGDGPGGGMGGGLLA